MTALVFNCRFQRPGGFTLAASFTAPAGVTALCGPSGAGKSTTLELIAGLLRPDAGSIVLHERVLFDAARGTHVPPEKRHIGLVFQDHLLFPHLTVKQNLLFGAGRGTRRIDPDRVVKTLELEPFLNRSPRSLSGGQQQRVALGRALLRGPELLLLDEPLVALDLPLKERILSWLERVLAEWDVPVIFVSHNPEDVRRLARHVVTLTEGHVSPPGTSLASNDNDTDPAPTEI